MEEILQELIKTTQEKGPQNKQFYSNLSITKPIHDHAEIQSRLEDAIAYIQSRFSSQKGFQSNFYLNRNCAIGWTFNLPPETCEILTSVFILDLLFNNLENDYLSDYQPIITLPLEIQDALQDFIVPTSGLQTFNLFKHLESTITSTSITEHHENFLKIHNNNIRDEEGFDSGNDSLISMLPVSNLIDNLNKRIFPVDDFPDDLNTTSLTLYVLLHQGILQPKPAESVLRYIIASIFKSNESHENIQPIKEEDHDPVALANFLNLIYFLDISHEAFLNAVEECLVSTLKHAVTSELSSHDDNGRKNITSVALPSSKSLDALGNTPVMVTSDNVLTDDKQKEMVNEKTNEEAIQLNSFWFHHNSPDSLLYFLSRTLALNGSTARPHVEEMKRLLMELLDLRLGSSIDLCDLAMRILSGVYLGVVRIEPQKKCKNNHHHQTNLIGNRNEHDLHDTVMPIAKLSRMKNLLQKEFELLLTKQNDIDGSWPADSIVQVGISTGNMNENTIEIGNDNEMRKDFGYSDGGSNNNYVESEDYNGSKKLAYLGSKELSTVFAIKAITTYLNEKKQLMLNFEDKQEVEQKALEESSRNLEIHHLY